MKRNRAQLDRRPHEPPYERKELIARTLWYDLNPDKVPGGIKGIVRPHKLTHNRHKYWLEKAAPGNLEAYGKLTLDEAIAQYMDIWWHGDWVIKPPRTRGGF